MRSYLILLSIAPLFGQFDLRPPSFGCHVDSTRQLRRLDGVRASLVASPVVDSVTGGLCDGGLVLYQSGGEVVLSNGNERHALALPEGAKLALDEAMAVAASPVSGELYYWNDDGWQLSPARVESSLVALRVEGGRAMLLSADHLSTIDIVSGAVERSEPIPAFSQVVSVLSDGSILTVIEERWSHCSGGGCSDLGNAPAEIDSLVPLRDGWLVAATRSGTVHAVRVTDGRVESFLLPGSAQEGSGQEGRGHEGSAQE